MAVANVAYRAPGHMKLWTQCEGTELAYNLFWRRQKIGIPERFLDNREVLGDCISNELVHSSAQIAVNNAGQVGGCHNGVGIFGSHDHFEIEPWRLRGVLKSFAGDPRQTRATEQRVKLIPCQYLEWLKYSRNQFHRYIFIL